MPMSLSQKKAYVTAMEAMVDQAMSVIVVENQGLSSPQSVSLRESARAVNVTIKTSKNSLTKRVFKESKFDSLNEELVGPAILMFSNDAPGDAAKIIKNIGHDKLVVKALSLGAGTLAASELSRVAQLPNRLEAIQLLMSAMQAPVRSLASVMQQTYSGLVRALHAVSEQKQST
jgi:large subunit ribosomal protein L10